MATEEAVGAQIRTRYVSAKFLAEAHVTEMIQGILVIYNLRKTLRTV